VHRYWTLILLLGAVWGASYLFIKVAVEGGLEPAPLMCARTAIAVVLLFAYLVRTIGAGRAVTELRASWRHWVVMGVIANALPFWLIGWGEKHVDSGVAAIAQSTVPLFTLLLGLRFLPHEPVTRAQAAGLGLGLSGVAVLAGGGPAGGWWAFAGTLAVVLASVAYGAGNVVAQRSVGSAPGPVMATGAMLAAATVLAPLAIVQRPTAMPSANALLSLLGLALLGTALAQLLLYRTVRLYGGRRLSLVTYLIPGFALAYGAILLGEPITLAALGGLSLILAGVALGSGASRAVRRSARSGASDPAEARAA
jgi:drug/metabolite transporter (DMT)-like permease